MNECLFCKIIKGEIYIFLLFYLFKMADVLKLAYMAGDKE